jgi:hypothetical protein
MRKESKMKSPIIPISWGELFDKISILQIKLDLLSSKAALQNVKRELTQLQSIADVDFPSKIEVQTLNENLKRVNQELWDIEDKIRDKEKDKIFDNEFIELARAVYITNDERSRIKRRINEALGSDLIEEKSYSEY